MPVPSSAASRTIRYAVPALAILLLAGSPAASAQPQPPVGWVKQAGTYDYLIAPDYDGLRPLADVVGNATLGLGTFDRLDGELVLKGGVIYRVGTDGVPRPADLATTTPFFEGIRFSPQQTVTLPTGTACSALLPLINEVVGGGDGMVALRLTGTFSQLTARSVAAQQQPYPPLSTVVAEQVEFPMTHRAATLVGFRTGSDLAGIGAPGVHLHGITTDMRGGGHILSCTTGPGVRLSLQRTQGVRVTGQG